MLITLLQNMLQSDGADAYIKKRRENSKYVTMLIIIIIVIKIIVIIREHDAKPHTRERKELYASSPVGFLNSTVSNAIKYVCARVRVRG
jgi:hypothetical protein